MPEIKQETNIISLEINVSNWARLFQVRATID